MVKVTKEKAACNRDIVNVHTDDGVLSIYFAKDMNLYFDYSGNNIENNSEYRFTINKECPFLYECFDNLYDSVMSQRPYRYSENLANTEYVYLLSKCCCELVHDDDIIDWHSDNEDYDLSSVLAIIKEDDSYILNFKRARDGHSFVRIRNGGSGYDPYNAAFMIMYNKIRNHDFELDKDMSRVRKR